MAIMTAILSRMRLRRAHRWAAAVALLAALAATLFLPAQGRRLAGAGGGVATFALQPGANPANISPVTPPANFSVANTSDFTYLLYPPLFWFGNDGHPTFNRTLSMAQPPVFGIDHAGRTTVTVRLRPYRWSDGQPVTSRDVEFWLDLIRAVPADWAAYVPGNFPMNIAAMSFPSPDRFTLTFRARANPTWLLDNELSQIFPIPQHAWDRTSMHGPVGNFDRTQKGAAAVLAFLSHQAANVATYATNPLWKVVDGPWRISAYNPSTQFTSYVSNPRYPWPVRPRLGGFEEVPFTSDTAEFNALRSGTIDYGYLPTQDLSQLGYLRRHGFRVVPWLGWQYNYIPLNFTNPTTGPLVRQLYLRQAMQHLINEPQYIARILRGYGFPTNGPVPVQPLTDLVSPRERNPLYPFDVGAARSMLEHHGWAMGSGGVRVCRRAGAGPDACGRGISAGTKLALTLLYATGSVVVSQEVEAMKSTFSQAGIDLSLRAGPYSSVFGVSPCSRTGVCRWEMAYWGTGWVYEPDTLPTGGELYATGAGSNPGGYSDPVNDANIAATHRTTGLGTFYRYEDYLAAQLPDLWMPNSAYQVSVISQRLQGTLPQDPLENLYPQNWRLGG